LDIIVVTNNVDYHRVSILNKKFNYIFKPKGYTYDQIYKIVVTFKDYKFEFRPEKAINLFPHQFKEVNSIISKYSFNKIPVWNLDILETKDKIEVQLSNVVKSKVVLLKNRHSLKENESVKN